jgi:hypothetical protein
MHIEAGRMSSDRSGKGDGRKKLAKVVERYSDALEKNVLRKLSGQNITTKFVLPMFEAFGWDMYKVTEKGPEVHEKAFRDTANVGKGLPDVRPSCLLY